MSNISSDPMSIGRKKDNINYFSAYVHKKFQHMFINIDALYIIILEVIKWEKTNL
jgi:hypothetical protein